MSTSENGAVTEQGDTLTPEQVDAKVREALAKDQEAKPQRSRNEAFADDLIADAIDYRETQRETLKNIGANRDMLRNFKTLGKLNATQASAVDLIYPVREAKPRAAKPAAETPKTPNGNEGVAVKAKPAPAKA